MVWMSKRIGRILEFAKDFLAPRRCPLCGEIIWSKKPCFWCSSCWENLPWLKPPFCSKCGDPFYIFPVENRSEELSLCGECLTTSPPYDMIRSACVYDGIVAKLITGLKYGKRLYDVPSLGELLGEAIFRWLREETIDLIVPIPMHIDKLKERGFNQSVLLAKDLAKRVGIPWNRSVLVKIRNTPPQVRLHKTARKKNLKGAFAVHELWSSRLSGTTVLLVDDVITTGSTILECAKILKKAGASKVIGLSVARTRT
ncbi:MAG: ComF family protein [Thermodesulforhabdaceae bacterium]